MYYCKKHCHLHGMMQHASLAARASLPLPSHHHLVAAALTLAHGAKSKRWGLAAMTLAGACRASRHAAGCCAHGPGSALACTFLPSCFSCWLPQPRFSCSPSPTALSRTFVPGQHQAATRMGRALQHGQRAMEQTTALTMRELKACAKISACSTALHTRRPCMHTAAA